MCQGRAAYSIAATDSIETPFKCHTVSLRICSALSWAAAGTGSQPVITRGEQNWKKQNAAEHSLLLAIPMYDPWSCLLRCQQTKCVVSSRDIFLQRCVVLFTCSCTLTFKGDSSKEERGWWKEVLIGTGFFLWLLSASLPQYFLGKNSLHSNYTELGIFVWNSVEKPQLHFNKQTFRVPGWMFQLAVGQMDLKSVPLGLSTPFMSQIDGSSFLRVSLHLLYMSSACSSEFCCETLLSRCIFR